MQSAARVSSMGGSGSACGAAQSPLSGAGALPMQNNIVLQRHMELMYAYQRQLQEEEAEQHEQDCQHEQLELRGCTQTSGGAQHMAAAHGNQVCTSVAGGMHLSTRLCVCVCVCVWARVRVRACVRACMCSYQHLCGQRVCMLFCAVTDVQRHCPSQGKLVVTLQESCTETNVASGTRGRKVAATVSFKGSTAFL